jgi:HSP20 family protein
MTNLTRWNPFREMMNLRSEIDRLFDQSMNLDWPTERPIFGELAIDLSETDDNYLVQASIPGIDPNNLEISVTNNVLTVKGEFQEEKDEEGKQWHIRERRSGSFSRSVRFPILVEANKVVAEYENGVLNLTVPKAEEVKPKRIAIKVGSNAPKVIESGKTK